MINFLKLKTIKEKSYYIKVQDRNILANLTKKSKEIYCKLYFQENKNNLVKVWNGINK